MQNLLFLPEVIFVSVIFLLFSSNDGDFFFRFLLRSLFSAPPKGFFANAPRAKIVREIASGGEIPPLLQYYYAHTHTDARETLMTFKSLSMKVQVAKKTSLLLLYCTYKDAAEKKFQHFFALSRNFQTSLFSLPPPP